MIQPTHDFSYTPRGPAITQAELRELVENIAIARRIGDLFSSVRQRLLAGAEVEEGDLQPVIENDQRKQLSISRLREAFGEDEARRIIDKCAEVPLRRLKICIHGAKPLGWAELSRRESVLQSD